MTKRQRFSARDNSWTLRRAVGVIHSIVSGAIIIRAAMQGIETVNVYIVVALLCLSGVLEATAPKNGATGRLWA
ncbi:hypothetical protein [Sphingomonas sp.]|uniref:hypothetical protein n=1 Tax=Sphingomonas sp. TaxID=28214 RepID=UPI003B3A6FF8